jgi:hypothetical protein
MRSSSRAHVQSNKRRGLDVMEIRKESWREGSEMVKEGGIEWVFGRR